MKNLILALTLIAAPAFIVPASPLAADPFSLLESARTLFPDQPRLEAFKDGENPCGMGQNSHPAIGYCSTQRVMYYYEDFVTHPNAAYEMAHVMGHF